MTALAYSLIALGAFAFVVIFASAAAQPPRTCPKCGRPWYDTDHECAAS